MPDRGPDPELSVLIPTYRRAGKLAACLRALAAQDLPTEAFEVIVGLDGPDDASASAADEAWTPRRGSSGLRVLTLPREGIVRVRNRMIGHARGSVLVSLNDDVLPGPGFLRIHRDQQRAASRAGTPAIISGHSPFLRRASESVFDRMLAETDLVFFYAELNRTAGDRDADRGFRNCFGLNFSAPMDAVRHVGGFADLPIVYGYEDIELAFRVQRASGAKVLYRPEAEAVHDHAYTPEDLERRETALGRAAWGFASSNPAFGLALFGRDVASDDELAYSREFVRRERSSAERVRENFRRLAEVPGEGVPGEVLRALAQQWWPLKRWLWRSGLVEAAEGASAGAAITAQR